ncbi:MAG: endolytic transglycosylase MltG [Patescibacteria group bacterium]
MKRYAVGASRRRWSRIWLGLLMITLVVAGATVFMVRRSYNQNLRPISASERAVVVTVKPGSTVQDIAKQLQEQGIIRSSWAFEWYVRINDLRDRLQAGTYSLRPSQSIQDIASILTHGKVNVSQVTIFPGKRIDQVRESLINDGFSPESVDAALEPGQYADSPALSDKPKNANLEGYLYPETFQKTADTKPETIIRASLDEMHTYLSPEIRAGIARQGLTVHQGVILASIIEREVGNPVDRPKVAQIFLKRIKSDIALESDATAGYGAILAGAEPSIFYESAYNTYKNKNLPPGPISNVTKTSLEAVANPAMTDFLYFVSGDDNENGVSITYFSKTLPEHEANVSAHCRKKCGR